ncbi:MAG: hypothetical protein ABL884_02670 [Methyloglobulus sp.]
MKTANNKYGLFLYIVASILTSFLLVESAKAADPPHLFWALDVATNVSPEHNMYDSNPSYIHWPDVNGAVIHENRTKCSSFITNVLMQSYGWTSTDFRNWMSSTSPTADKYYDAIRQQNGFVVIDNVNDIQPGDIIAIKYPSGSTATGHIMLAKTTASPRTATLPIVAETSQYQLQIIDSSQTGHGPTDSRLNEDGTYNPGAGIGILRLYANSVGVVVGYTWSTYNSSKFYDPTTRPIIIGRLI